MSYDYTFVRWYIFFISAKIYTITNTTALKKPTIKHFRKTFNFLNMFLPFSYSTDRPAFWNLEQNWSSILTIKRFDTLTTSMISIETQWFKDFLVHNIFWTCELWHIDFLLITLEKQRLLIFFELGK